MFDALAGCQSDVSSIVASPATCGHSSLSELSHCVIPKELSAVAARPSVPRMWALDLAQRAGRKGKVSKGGRCLHLGMRSADDLACQPVAQQLLATVLSGSEAAK